MPVNLTPPPSPSCAVCGRTLYPPRRRYCCEACFALGRREYKARHQRQASQRARCRAWRRSHRAERAQYNRAHYQANRERYLAMMRRRWERRQQ